VLSKTKKQLSDSEIAEISKRAFGPSAAVQACVELTDGWFNAAYDIRLGDGRNLVLKVSPPDGVKTMRYEQNMMHAEIEALRLLKAAGKVPVPEVLYADLSREFIDCGYFFVQKLEGVPFNRVKDSMSPEESARIETELGVYNRQINELTNDRFGCLGLPESHKANWQEAFRQLTSWALQDGVDAGVELPESYEAIERLFERHDETLKHVTEPKLVYWDLWEGNVFVSEGSITGLIDAERALWGDPLMEHYFGFFSRSEPFWSSYGMDPRSPENAVRRALYDFYLALVLVIECAYRGYDERHENWARTVLTERISALKALG
jgi:fructosamine-3-kinase